MAELTEKQYLLQHLYHGRENAITGSRIAHLLGYRDDRRIRLMIRELIAEGVPIASSVHPPYGFYIARNRREVEDYAQGLKDRLVADGYRRKEFLRAAREILKPEQIRLPMETRR